MRQHKESKSIVVVARQAGSANAFVPLFREFQESNFRVHTFAFTHAHKIFASNKIDATLIERFEPSLFGDLSEPSFLLTGTSEYADEDDRFWQWAKSRGIPSLAFVDSWVSYWQRFTPSGVVQKRFSITPDLIGVIDRFMYDRMVDSGCDEKLLIVTGNPAFDCLRRYVPREQKDIVGTYGEDYVLFIGEPFNNRLHVGNEKDVLGYTEAEVLRVTADAVQMMEGEKFKLVVRPHPRSGCTDEIKSIIDSHSNIVVDAEKFNSRDLVACGKAVVGMTSMLLYEASLMGVPAISIRPNKKLSSDVIDCSSKIPVVTSSRIDDVLVGMTKILSAKPEPLNTENSKLCDAIRSIVNKQ
jgi:hypothetical protein